MAHFEIVRSFNPSFGENAGKSSYVVTTFDNLEDAQNWCRRESTHKILEDGTVIWFDGYREG